MVATFLNSFVNHAHIVKMANMAQLVNVIAPMFTNEQGMFLQTIYHPLALFANNIKGKALELFVDVAEVQVDTLRRRPVSGRVGGVGQRDRGDQRGQSPSDQAIEAEIEAQDKQFAGPVAVTEVNGPDIKAENDFGKTTVQPVTKSATADGKQAALHASRRTRTPC